MLLYSVWFETFAGRTLKMFLPFIINFLSVCLKSKFFLAKFGKVIDMISFRMRRTAKILKIKLSRYFPFNIRVVCSLLGLVVILRPWSKFIEFF